MSLELALASPSTLNTPLHTLSCTAFSIASAVDDVALKVPGPHANPSEPSQVHERFFESESRKVNICAAAAPIITSTSACFA